jgi:energy-coupling factor transporter ATP-binding protein EcfA2
MNSTGIERSTNPFSSRWVRPGALPFCFSANESAARVVEKLQRNNWRGAIVGPHGSGKSTLLATLLPFIKQLGRSVQWISLHNGQRKLPHKLDLADANSLVIIDGFEQLSWWMRRQIIARTRRWGCGLLVTVHQESSARRLPVLFQTTGELAMVRRLIDDFLPSHSGLIQPDDVSAAFQMHRGNARDTLFSLYDLFEQRRQCIDC